MAIIKWFGIYFEAYMSSLSRYAGGYVAISLLFASVYHYCTGSYDNEKTIERSLKCLGVGLIVLLISYDAYNLDVTTIALFIVATLIILSTKKMIKLKMK